MKTVFVGLSGGVDSAVSAALLKARGHRVVGAFIKIWSPEFLECTWKEDRLDALRVCAALGIPFREIDLSDEYKREVVAQMVSEYREGITPNPDVLCNRSIKFGHFAKWAFGEGAEAIATGHYARIRAAEDQFELLRGADRGKDQSYFLYRLTQENLRRTLFPVGEYTKPQVRELAKRFGLPNAAKRDSQGLCFVGDVSLKEFLGRFIELKPGDVVDEQGERLGTHDGAALYTIGERHGFSAKGDDIRYVTSIDVERNLVRVSARREAAARESVGLSGVHWITQAPALAVPLRAQARYREPPVAASLIEREGSFRVAFQEPRIAAPGQSLVLYQADTCLGGGVINR